MPNNTETRLIVRGKVEDILRFRKNHFHDDKYTEFDFDTIIPEPRTIDECEPEYRVKSAKEAHIAEDEERPWFNWYEWHIAKWGTKWNSYDTMAPSIEEIVREEMTEIYVTTYTAWSPALPVYGKLQEMYPELEIEVFFLDEGCFYAGYLDKHGEVYISEEVTPKDDIVQDVAIGLGYDNAKQMLMIDDDEDEEDDQA